MRTLIFILVLAGGSWAGAVERLKVYDAPLIMEPSPYEGLNLSPAQLAAAQELELAQYRFVAWANFEFPQRLRQIDADILLARDLWMHRDDVCQALGRAFDAGPYADELIAQVIYDLEASGPFWGDRPAVVLELTGPGGGTYRVGRGEPVGRAAVDAVSYMRTLSGRDDSPVVTGDPAAADAVADCRMPF